MLRLTRLFSTTSVASKIGYKKPPNLRGLFIKEWYPKVLETNQGATSKEILKLTADKWNQSPSSVKDEFQAIYEQKLEGFKNKDPEFAYEVKPEPPFESFSSKNYKKVARQLKTKDKKAITEELTKLWNEVSEGEKTKLTSSYERALARYKKKKSKNGRINRPPNLYMIFASERISAPEYADKTPTERLKVFAEQWKNFSENEKSKYYDQYAVLKEKYDAEVAAKKKPSLPLTKYNLFVKLRFAGIKEANPDLHSKEILKQVAEEWRAEKEKL